MSEYQYYEFRALDRPLTEKQMVELRALSTRAEITPTSFTNTYHYGDFRGNPRRLVEQYFDIFLYVANWGTRRLILRVPKQFLDLGRGKQYATGEELSVWPQGECTLVEFHSEEEGGYWEQGEGYLDDLLPVRAELLAGDLRCLYLGWLLGLDRFDVDEGELEPPVPPGLGNLSRALESFARFLRVDEALIEVAAERSVGEPLIGPSREDFATWLAALPPSEKDALLLRLVSEESPHLRWELLRRFREEQSKGQKTGAGLPRRTVAELTRAWENHAEDMRRQAAEEEARERRRIAEEKARARAQHLQSLVGKEKSLWGEVETAIGSKTPKGYKRAIEFLTDLRDLGEHTRRKEEFSKKMQDVRSRYRSRPSLIRGLNEAGLP